MVLERHIVWYNELANVGVAKEQSEVDVKKSVYENPDNGLLRPKHVLKYT
jgi:hypothetical protein